MEKRDSGHIVPWDEPPDWTHYGKWARQLGGAMEQVLATGDKVLIAHRRLYEHDQPRFFVGIVDVYDAGMMKVTGYCWIREPIRGDLEKKADRRTKIISILSAGYIVYQLPSRLDLDALVLGHDNAKKVVLSDGDGFMMDLTDRTQGVRLGSAA